jgi:hypothetical protein
MRFSLPLIAAVLATGVTVAHAETPNAAGEKSAQPVTQKTVCSWEERTGSIRPTKVCRTVTLSKKQQEAADRSNPDRKEADERN